MVLVQKSYFQGSVANRLSFSMTRELPEQFICIKVCLGIPFKDDTYGNQSTEIQAGQLARL